MGGFLSYCNPQLIKFADDKIFALIAIILFNILTLSLQSFLHSQSLYYDLSHVYLIFDLVNIKIKMLRDFLHALFIHNFQLNKDENAHRYAVRGKKIKIYVESKTHRERQRVRSVRRTGGHENITRKGYLVYHDTKVNNLQRCCLSKNVRMYFGEIHTIHKIISTIITM